MEEFLATLFAKMGAALIEALLVRIARALFAGDTGELAAA
jgi:hypothetical protein